MSNFKLVRSSNDKAMSQMHEIREKVLFPDGDYDRNHPDDRKPNHHCFIFLANDMPVGTVRLDFIHPHEAAVRLVAILPEYQGQKIGLKMMSDAENYAKSKGIKKLVTNSAKNAIKFYESLGFSPQKWTDPGEGIGRPTFQMAKDLKVTPIIIKATINDYPVIQNMARFYVYDLTRYCGFISEDWACPTDGLFADVDLKNYFQDSDREAYLVKIGNELAGFALLHHVGSSPNDYWVMAEFFILAKFQGQGIGSEVAEQLWKMHPGKWEIPIIPENLKALSFWRKIVSSFTSGQYREELKNVEYDKHQSKRYVLTFDTNNLGIPSNITLAVGQSNEVDKVVIEEISPDQAEILCRKITTDLPKYFGIPSANEAYFKGVHQCKNLAAKTDDDHVGLLSLNFPQPNNANIYWMAVFKDQRKKGIGRKLIDVASKLAVKANAATMTVETLDPAHADENYLI